jgi:GNAT superfamily N-acetyltransferase
MESGTLLGFLIAVPPTIPAPSSLRIMDVHHAADPAQARHVYRTLYEAIAGRLVRLGVFSHRILVLTSPPTAFMAFFEMGFGVDQVKGVRPITPELRPSSRCVVEPATLEDVDDLVELWVELTTFHSRSPILLPALPVDRAAASGELRAAIQAKDCAVLIARKAGHIVGMMEAHPDRRYVGTATIGLNIVTETARSGGIGTAMLDELLRWAAATGFQQCAVGWASANLISDAFYRGHGFVPIRYELAREVDQRISWANEGLDRRAWRR